MLTDTAMGRVPADVVIKNGKLVQVYTSEILENAGVAVKCGRVALIGDVEGAVGPETEVVDAEGCWLVPGFLDGHLHVESSMMTVGAYARAVLPHGTAGIFMDPHEIVNVAGLAGMRAMMEDGEQTPLRVFTTTPSCVPASPGLEHTGAALTPEDIAGTMRWEGVAGLGEMMNFPGILAGDPDTCRKVAVTLRAGKPVTGHFPLDDTGALLNAYADAGICCCHESTAAEQALAKMRLGMYAMLREGSAWDDLPEVIKAVTERKADPRMAVLVSDDLHADTLLTRGHMDAIVRLAISLGLDPVTAIQMATLNTACCFGLDRELGAIAPGRLADLNLLSDLKEVKVERVLIGGRTVAQNGEVTVSWGPYRYPDSLRNSVRLPGPLSAGDFAVSAPAGASEVNARVIGIRPSSALTEAFVRALPVRGGEALIPQKSDLCKAAVFYRHGGQGSRSVGFVEGFGIEEGAVASTYAHDAHNLVVVGKNEADMACAANRLLSAGGGMAVAKGGRVLAELQMPIAGLMSDRPAEEVALRLRELSNAWASLGSTVPSAFMTMSLLSLSVIPELRITDMGLVDVLHNRLVPLFL